VGETWSKICFKIIIFVTPHALNPCESFLLENKKLGDFGDKKRRCFALEVWNKVLDLDLTKGCVFLHKFTYIRDGNVMED